LSDPASQVVADGQDYWFSGLPHPPCRHRDPVWFDGILPHEVADQVAIFRIQLLERLLCSLTQRTRFRSKARLTGVAHEHIRREQVFPSFICSSHGEVVLLAITFPEDLGTEQPDIGETVPADVHADPDGGREGDPVVSIHLSEDRVEICVGRPRLGVTADGRIVGKWGYCSDPRTAVGGRYKTIQPVVVHP